jgi:hypothetical protein
MQESITHWQRILLQEQDLSPNQKKIAKLDPPTDELDAGDFKALRAGKKMEEEQDHEVSMANNSLESILKAAMELKSKLGHEEKDIPAWIQDHITNAANYISQAADNYHEYSQQGSEEDLEECDECERGDMSLQGMMEDLFEAKKKPSAGLTKKQKSTIAKKAKAGKDVGKKGKGFEKVAAKAAKEYGSKERGQKVAAAAMWKAAAKKAK